MCNLSGVAGGIVFNFSIFLRRDDSNIKVFRPKETHSADLLTNKVYCEPCYVLNFKLMFAID